jgi:hypothetical protein
MNFPSLYWFWLIRRLALKQKKEGVHKEHESVMKGKLRNVS